MKISGCDKFSVGKLGWLIGNDSGSVSGDGPQPKYSSRKKRTSVINSPAVSAPERAFCKASRNAEVGAVFVMLINNTKTINIPLIVHCKIMFSLVVGSSFAV